MLMANFFSKPLLIPLLVSSFLSICLLLFRFGWTGTETYGFLLWNLYLAWLPLFFAELALRQPATKKWFSRTSAYLLLWLLFFPNSPYIITDLFHLYPRENVPLWFDAVLLVSYIWNGLVVGLISLVGVHAWLRQRFTAKESGVLVGGVLLLASLGVYIGRYWRWNSWDVFIHPVKLLKEAFIFLMQPHELAQVVGVTLVFWFFLSAAYQLLYQFIHFQPRFFENK